MTPLSKPKTHLPLLYNVFLNSIFNNPQYDKSPFKQTIHELSVNPNEYALLVPPSYVLEDAYDPASTNGSTKVYLRDLCYNSEDFLRSHILRTNLPFFNSSSSSKNQLIIYQTLSGKQILVKNGMIFTGKGFNRSLRLSILGFGQMTSFSDYFPRGSKFTLIYIEDALTGSNFPRINDYMDPKFLDLPPVVPIVPTDDIPKKSSTLTFEMLLRSIPLLSVVVSEKYFKLFHHNNRDYELLRNHTRKKLSFIESEFNRMVNEAYAIILDSIKADTVESEKTYHLIRNLLSSNPDIDLNKLVYEYVEINQYDKIWSQLIYQFNYPNDDKLTFDPDAYKHLTQEKYNQLSCLSLNQMDIPIEEPWHINTVLRRVALAIDEFSNLSDSSITSLSSKREVISRAVNILTTSTSDSNGVYDEKEDSDLVIDADTLVGMMVMVVVHSKVPDLEAHLFYIKNFNNNDNDGYFNYILSNLYAVIFHLSSTSNSEHLDELVASSQENYEFWVAIQKQDLKALENLLQATLDKYGDSIPAKHFLRSKNIKGESCLMFAIKARSPIIFDLIIDYNENWFSVEDILFDQNTTTGQNLLIVSLVEEVPSISSRIVDILLSSTEEEEYVAYFNQADFLGRTVGHYLFHNVEVLDKIGGLIDWEKKDLSEHTPLFSICRCYDHPNYQELISRVFKCVYKTFRRGIDFDKHIDKNGNTLFHVILKGLKESCLLDPKLNLVNINQLNQKSMAPLTLYVKYSRVSNLEQLLEDKRLQFLAEEPKNLYNVFDYLSFLASKSSSNGGDFKQIETAIINYTLENYISKAANTRIIATNARYDSTSKDWVIFFKVGESGSTLTVIQSLEQLKKMLQLFDMKNPYLAFPDKSTLWMNFRADKQTVPGYSKFNINRLIDSINVYMAAISIHSPEVCKSFLLSSESSNSKKKLAFEIMKEVGRVQENQKRSLGEVMLSSGQILEIETFLKYSLADLDLYVKAIVKVNRLLAVYDFKATDSRVVQDTSLIRLISSDLVPALRLSMRFKYCGEHQPFHSYHRLLDYTLWLELATRQLMVKITATLHKLDNWRVIHGKIKSINNELKKYESKANIHSHDVLTQDDDSHGVEPPTSPVGSTSFFGFGLENKKSRYRRLLLIKAEEVKNIMSLNAEIKMDHEGFASEISLFLRFRSALLLFGLKQFTQQHLVNVRQRLYELQRLRHSI